MIDGIVARLRNVAAADSAHERNFVVQQNDSDFSDFLCIHAIRDLVQILRGISLYRSGAKDFSDIGLIVGCQTAGSFQINQLAYVGVIVLDQHDGSFYKIILFLTGSRQVLFFVSS
jgi:hypothetical protein